MKRLNYLLGCILSLSLLFACSKDDDGNHGGGENHGDVFASFSIKMGGVGTYATSGTAEQGEDKLSNVHIFMFDKDADTLVSSGGIIMNGIQGSTTLATTLGKKNVYALINAINNINFPIFPVGTKLEDFRNGLKQSNIQDDEKIAKSGEFLMFGLDTVTITVENNETEAKAKASPIVINVNRISSKVSFVYDGANVQITNLKGAISDIGFALNQTHTQLDIVRELRIDEVTTSVGDVNYTPTDPTKVDQIDTENLGTYGHLYRLKAPITYKAASTEFGEASTIENSFYCLENINETPVTGNSTFVIVKLKFKPIESDFSDYATTKTLDADGNFWTVTLYKLKYIFATEVEANASIASGAAYAGGIVQKHIGGDCYYRLNLRNPKADEAGKTEEQHLIERYAVLRNSIYRVSIRSVKGVGEDTPENLIPTDPETDLEEEAFMVAHIEILPWTVFDIVEDLN